MGKQYEQKQEELKNDYSIKEHNLNEKLDKIHEELKNTIQNRDQFDKMLTESKNHCGNLNKEINGLKTEIEIMKQTHREKIQDLQAQKTRGRTR